MLIQLQVALTISPGGGRQTLVSLTGVVLGVAFFLAVSSLMRGSEQDFIKRLVDNSPHITVSDDVRRPRTQPAERRWASGGRQNPQRQAADRDARHPRLPREARAG